MTHVCRARAKFLNVDMQVTVTRRPITVTRWITYISSYLSLSTVHPKLVFLSVFAADTHDRPGVLQIVVHRHCLFFQLAHAPQMPDSLRQFLVNRLYTFVGRSIESGLERLHRYYQIGGDATWSVDLGYRFRPPEEFAGDWTVRRLAHDRILMCWVEGYAYYLSALYLYGVYAGICTALLIVLALLD